MEVYAVTFFAEKLDGYHNTRATGVLTDWAGCNKGFREKLKAKLETETAFEKMPTEQGWRNHRVFLCEVPSHVIKEAALAAMLEPEQ
jgi:hypothetical protein